MSELGLVTPGGKVVWGKYAQVSTGRASVPLRGCTCIPVCHSCRGQALCCNMSRVALRVL